MTDKKILYLADEIVPFTGDTDMATYCRFMPQHVQEFGNQTRTFMPKWGNINERRNQLHEVIRMSGMNLIIDDTDHPLLIKVASVPLARIQVYFIDNDDYFQERLMAVDEKGEFYKDNDERTVFFARGVLETVKKLRWNPDIIHCNGWISSLIPVYLKTLYKDEPSFRASKVVYSLHECGFDGRFRDDYMSLLCTKDLKPEEVGEFELPIDYNSIMKKALYNCDGVMLNANLSDPTLVDYAKELGKPIMPFNNQSENPKAVLNFYESLLK